jgi:hypothetical protein
MDIAIKRTPIFATKIQTASSGKELRASFQSTPRYRYSLPLNFLRQAVLNAGTDEVAMLLNIFNAAKGRWDSFLYTDPYSNTAVNTPFGTGDGSTSAFQLLDIEGMPIFDLNGTPTLTRTDWQGTQTLYSTARTNKTLYSQDMTQGAWNKLYSTITPNATAGPDGALNAGKLVEDTSNNMHRIHQSITISSGAQTTISVIAKAGERTRMILMSSGNYGSRGFDLSAGTTFAAGGGEAPATAYAMTSLGNGWYLCSITFTTAGTTDGLQVRMIQGSGTTENYTGDGSSGMYLRDFQYEVGNTATSRIVTTAAAVTITDYTLSSTGLVTLGQVPAVNAGLSWSGSYYRRVRFDTDELDFERFLDRVWEAKALPLISVK